MLVSVIFTSTGSFTSSRSAFTMKQERPDASPEKSQEISAASDDRLDMIWMFLGVERSVKKKQTENITIILCSEFREIYTIPAVLKVCLLRPCLPSSYSAAIVRWYSVLGLRFDNDADLSLLGVVTGSMA